MPTMEDYLTDIHLEMTRRGMPEMDDDTLRELAKRLQHPAVLQGFQSGQVTAAKIVDEVQAGQSGAPGASPTSQLLAPQASPDQAVPRLPVGTTTQPGPFGNRQQLLLNPRMMHPQIKMRDSRGFPLALPEAV